MMPFDPSQLEFDAERHVYHVGSRRLASVTECLKIAGLIDASFYTDFGRLRGHLVHQVIELHDQNDLNEDSVDPQLAPYLKAWQDFKGAANATWSHIEHRMADPALGVAGTMDRLGTVNGHLAIVDAKSGHPAAWIGPQTAGYALLAQANGLIPSARTVKRYGVFLRSSGDYRLVEYVNREDLGVFTAAATLAQWKLVHGKGVEA
jgi:hypothetical protein